eukprot:TRINITY_DN1739_c0_g1_i1.p1 TRINITY_DN1739_c0_g1~~TRINITY_DN1739_c0_g1_i1.p1  ORF type:complete len:288 (+),score=15.97 TRINITY_DN1739_c0_g1_i1:656-1519(+)
MALNDLRLAFLNINSANDLRLGCNVTTITKSKSGHVTGCAVSERGGPSEQWDAPLVINATGPWCQTLDRSANVSLPIELTPIRSQVIYKVWDALHPENLCNTPTAPFAEHTKHASTSTHANTFCLPHMHDGYANAYLRPQYGSKQILIGTSKEYDVCDINKPRSTCVDSGTEERLLLKLFHRLPDIPRTRACTGVVGVFMQSEDDLPILGPSLTLPGYYHLCGDSGHSFKTSPALGSLIARLLFPSSPFLCFDSQVSSSHFSPTRKIDRVRFNKLSSRQESLRLRRA